MLNLRFILFFLLFPIVYQGTAQINFSEINYSKIKQKKIQEYLHVQEKENLSLLDIQPSLQKNSDIKGFRKQTNEYFVKGSLKEVWKHYLATSPSDSWNSKKVTFGMLFSKKEKKVLYKDDYVSKINTGQVVYLNLKLFSGLANIAAAFEFISIDVKRKIFEFSYIKGNKTEGKQQIQFIETEKGDTKIIHSSFYKSSSYLRDRLLYPYFHTRLVNEFHRNMKRLFRTHEKPANAIFSATKSISLNMNNSKKSFKGRN